MYIYVYTHTDIQTYRHTPIYTYTHTHIHTYTHTHIHIHLCISNWLYKNHWMVVCCLENHLREKGSGKDHQGDLKSQQGYEDPPSAGDSLCPRMVDLSNRTRGNQEWTGTMDIKWDLTNKNERLNRPEDCGGVVGKFMGPNMGKNTTWSKMALLNMWKWWFFTMWILGYHGYSIFREAHVAIVSCFRFCGSIIYEWLAGKPTIYW